MSRRPTRWETDTGEGHSQWYIERFRTMAAEGADLAGEARMVDAMLPRGSRILDAGCGPGRVGGELHQRGHRVVGVDVDPELVAAAEEDHPGPRWLVADLAALDLADEEPFDLVVVAGNVMLFVAPGTERKVLERLAAHVRPGGRIVIGFR
ncbi:MAG TPA: class I SAM-dependent methyltransferase, partial [Microthrixaceae bacterium]|nr:class I SAM-dependent methyltransferase [Microthrixaceae bacterium]